MNLRDNRILTGFISLPNDADIIREEVDSGGTVYVDSLAYVVIKDSIGQYLIHCAMTNYYIGLTWRDGKTLNGERFFVRMR